MRNAEALLKQPDGASIANADGGPLRILILDSDSRIITQIENALWMWPHKISITREADDAIRLCQHLTPSAILVAVDDNAAGDSKLISVLRRKLPTIPIIAIVSRKQQLTPGRILDQGADALLLREEANRPTLYDLLGRIQRKWGKSDVAYAPREPQLALPWHESAMLGALICDISGLIVDCNEALAVILGYVSGQDLLGRNVVRDLLFDRNDWVAWPQVAGDTRAMLHQENSVAAKNGQILFMQVEVFAASNHPNYLQAVFVDRTERVFASDGQCAAQSGMPD